MHNCAQLIYAKLTQGCETVKDRLEEMPTALSLPQSNFTKQENSWPLHNHIYQSRNTISEY